MPFSNYEFVKYHCALSGKKEKAMMDTVRKG